MEKSQSQKQDLFDILRKRPIWIPVKKGDGKQIQLQILQNSKSESYIPVFFSPDSEMGWLYREELVSMEFSRLRYMVIDLPEEIYGLALEPFSENMIMDRAVLEKFDQQTAGMSVMKSSHDRQTELHVPVRLPLGLRAALKRFLEEEGVQEGWILLARNESEKNPHLMVAVDFSGNRIDLFPKMAEVIRPFMEPGQQFELIKRGNLFEKDDFDEARILKTGGR